MSEFKIEVNNGLENVPWGTLSTATGADIAGDKNIIEAFNVFYKGNVAKASGMHYRLIQKVGEKWIVAHAGNSNSVVGAAIDAPGIESKVYHIKIESEEWSDGSGRRLIAEKDFNFFVDADAMAFLNQYTIPEITEGRLITMTEGTRVVWQGEGTKKKPDKGWLGELGDILIDLEKKKEAEDATAQTPTNWILIIGGIMAAVLITILVWYIYQHRAQIKAAIDCGPSCQGAKA